MMPFIQSGALRIHYEIHGSGYPVVLLHGGTVSFKYNYAAAGWIKALNDARLQVIGLDFRGHGDSDKPHDVAAYGTANLAGDVMSVIDHLGLQRVSLIAYSIGTAIALHLMQLAPARFENAALIATGDGLIGLPPHTFANVTPALATVIARTEYPRDLPKHLSAYWRFIEATSGDTQALLAFSEAKYPPLTAEEAGAISIPTLVVSGEHDQVLGRGPRLAEALGCGDYIEVQDADHFSLAADVATQARVIDFLCYRT